MKAMLVKEGKLVLSDTENPFPRANEVLIHIYAAALNRADLLQKKGTYPSPAGWPQWPGLECAGVVSAIGSGVKRCRIGDQVCALVGGGAYAEKICVPEEMTMPIPKGFSFEEAAAIPEAYATAYLNLFYEGHLKKGQTVYIAAGASGLASAAIPLAKSFGARVVTDVLLPENKAAVFALGADEIIDLTRERVSEAFERLEKAGTPVNLAMDCLAGAEMGKAIAYMAESGYWILISTLAGIATELPLRAVLTRGIHITGSMLRKRSIEEKGALLAELVKNVWPKFESGEIKPQIFRVFPFEEAEAAQAVLERGENIGKVVLKISK